MKKTVIVIVFQAIAGMGAWAADGNGGDDGYVLSPLPTQRLLLQDVGQGDEVIYVAPGAAPQPVSPEKSRQPYTVILPEVAPDSVAAQMLSIAESEPQERGRNTATAPADLMRSRYDRPPKEPDTAVQTWVVEGSVVLPHTLDGQSSSDGRIDSSDPYYTLDVAVQPGDGLLLQGYFWQTTSDSLQTDEFYGTASLLPDDQLSVSYGRIYLPFGSYNTNLLSSPLTASLGSVRSDRTVVIASDRERFFGNLFLYRSPEYSNGRSRQKTRFGVDAGVQGELGSIGASYLSNMADTDAFWPHDVSRDIPGMAAYGYMDIGSWTLSAEFVRALRSLKPGDIDGDITRRAIPAAAHAELSLSLPAERYMALSWSQTWQGAELFLDRRLVGLGYSQPLGRDFYAALEVSKRTDEDGEVERLTEVELEYSF